MAAQQMYRIEITLDGFPSVPSLLYTEKAMLAECAKLTARGIPFLVYVVERAPVPLAA